MGSLNETVVVVGHTQCGGVAGAYDMACAATTAKENGTAQGELEISNVHPSSPFKIHISSLPFPFTLMRLFLMLHCLKVSKTNSPYLH